MKTQSPKKIAVALEYDGSNAPKVTAKGVGEIAETILTIAREQGVPLQEDSGLVEILAQINLGEEIPENLYRAVAEVIAFAYILTGKFPPGYSEKIL